MWISMARVYICDVCKRVIGEDPYEQEMIEYRKYWDHEGTMGKMKHKIKLQLCKTCHQELINQLKQNLKGEN